MNKSKEIMTLSENITQKAVNIEYLSSTAIYEANDERIIYIFSEIALNFIRKIKKIPKKLLIY